MKLSLIIPVYNVEKYIEQCLTSICQQLPVPEVEVIMVDDGSPDQSVAKAQQFLAQQPEAVQQQFRIIRQNPGLRGTQYRDYAGSGEYVAFLDSDDYLNPQYFAEVFKGIETGADIIQFAVQRVDDQGNIIPFLHRMSKQGLQTLNQDILLELSNRSAWFAWLRVYKRALFQEIRFPVGKNYEDAYTTPLLFCSKPPISALKCWSITASTRTALPQPNRKNIDDLGGVPLFYWNAGTASSELQRIYDQH